MDPENQRSVSELMRVFDSVEQHSPQDLLKAIRELGQKQSVEALDRLLILWTNSGLIKTSSTPDYREGFQVSYHLVCPEFPKFMQSELRRQLGSDMHRYRLRQNMNSELLQKHALALYNGWYDEAESKLDFIKDETERTRILGLHSDLKQMLRKDMKKSVQYYFSFYKRLDSYSRATLLKEGNSYLILDSAIRSVAERLARSGDEEAVDKLIGIAEAQVKYSETSEKYCKEKDHWWSRPRMVTHKTSTDRHYDLHEQLIAIEALGFTRNNRVHNYLRALMETKKQFDGRNIFVNARGGLRNELTDSLRIIESESLDIGRFDCRGRFVDNGYLILASAISSLDAELRVM